MTTRPEIEKTKNHRGEELSTATTESSTSTTPMESLISVRPQQSSAHRATGKMKEWARVLAAPPPGGYCNARTMNPYYSSINTVRMITCHEEIQLWALCVGVSDSSVPEENLVLLHRITHHFWCCDHKYDNTISSQLPLQ